VVSFTPRPLYPRGKNPRWPMDQRLGGSQILVAVELFSSCQYTLSVWCRPYSALFCMCQNVVLYPLHVVCPTSMVHHSIVQCHYHIIGRVPFLCVPSRSAP
jgi:hypothetical protein